MNIHIAVLTMGNQENIDRLFSDLFWASVWGRVNSIFVLNQINTTKIQISLPYRSEPHLFMTEAVTANLGCAGGRKVLTEAIMQRNFKKDDVIIYLDDDVEVINFKWIQCLVEPLVWGYRLPNHSISGVDGRKLTSDLMTVPSDEVDYVSGGWCAIRGDVFLDGCMFDEQFNPNYFEDVDLCFQARAMSKSITAVGDIGLRHEHLAGASAAQLVDENRLKFGKKWGLL